MTAPSLAYQDAMNGIAILYDALSNAENELDNLKNTWIKCSDEMPNEHSPVLVVDEIKNVFVGVWDEYDGWDSISKITHWQPLPAPPKDK